MKILLGLDRVLTRIEGTLLVLFLSVMLGLSFVQVVLRNAFSESLLWGDILLRHLVLSTLMNTLLGQKISIVTNKPQTTRHKVLGILSAPGHQVIFLDTPGIIKPGYLLQEVMMQFASSAIQDADVLLFMVDATNPGTGGGAAHREAFARLQGLAKPVLLAINKVDLVEKRDLLPVIDFYAKAYPFREIFPVSAMKADGTAGLLASIVGLLPCHPPFYPADIVSERQERFFVAEIVREKLFVHRYVVLRDFARETFGEVVYGGLGRMNSEPLGRLGLASDVDDSAPVSLDHARNDSVLCEAPYLGEVERHGLLPSFIGRSHPFALLAAPRGVDQNVDAAELLGGKESESLGLLGLQQVDRGDDWLLALRLANLTGEIFQQHSASCGDTDSHAVTGKPLRHGTADSCARARYERGLTFEGGSG